VSFYNDVYTSAAALAVLSAASTEDMALELSGNYEYAQSRAEGRQRLFLEKRPWSPFHQWCRTPRPG